MPASLAARKQQNTHEEQKENIIMYIKGAPEQQIQELENSIIFIQDILGAAIQTGLSSASDVEEELNPKFIQHMNAVALKMFLTMVINSVSEKVRKHMDTDINKWIKDLEDILAETTDELNTNIQQQCINAIEKELPYIFKNNNKEGGQRNRSGLKSQKAYRRATEYQRKQSHTHEAKRLLESIDMKVRSAMKDIPQEMMGIPIDFGEVLRLLEEQARAKSEIRNPLTTGLLEKSKPFRATRGKLVAPFSSNLLRLIILLFVFQFATGENATETFKSDTPLTNSQVSRLSKVAETAVEGLTSIQVASATDASRQLSLAQIVTFAKQGPPIALNLSQKLSHTLSPLFTTNVAKLRERQENLQYFSSPEFQKQFHQSITLLERANASAGVINKLKWMSAYNILKTVQGQGSGFAIMAQGDEIKNFPWINENVVSDTGSPEFTRAIEGLSVGDGIGIANQDDASLAKRYILGDIVFEVEKDMRQGWGLAHISAGTNETATPITRVYLQILTTPPSEETRQLDNSIKDLEKTITTLRGNIIKLQETVLDNQILMSDALTPQINALEKQGKEEKKSVLTKSVEYLMSFVATAESPQPSFESLKEDSLSKLSHAITNNKILTEEQKKIIKNYITSSIELNKAKSQLSIREDALIEKNRNKFSKNKYAYTLSIEGTSISSLDALSIKALTKHMTGTTYSLVKEALKRVASEHMSIYVAGFYKADISNIPGYTISPNFRKLITYWHTIHRNLINYHTLSPLQQFDTNLALTAIAISPPIGAAPRANQLLLPAADGNKLLSTEVQIRAQQELLDNRHNFANAMISLGTSLTKGAATTITTDLIEFVNKAEFTKAKDNTMAAAVDRAALSAAEAAHSAALTAARDAAGIFGGLYKNSVAIGKFFGSCIPLITLSFMLINTALLDEEVADIITRIAASTAVTTVGATVGSIFPVVGTAIGGTAGGLVGLLISGGSLRTILKIMSTPTIVASLVFAGVARGVNPDDNIISAGIVILNIVGSAITGLRRRNISPDAIRNGGLSFFSRFNASSAAPPAPPAGAAAQAPPPPAGVAREIAGRAVMAAAARGGARLTRRRPRKQRSRLSHATKRSVRR